MAGETFLPDLITRMRLDTSDMEAGVGRAAALGGAIGGAIGGLAAAGIQQGLAAVTGFVGGSVSAFSQLEDSTAAAGVIFGDSMTAITDQASRAASTMGLSSQQVISAANTFGTYGKSADLAGADLAKFSTDMTGLAGDLASFKGTSPEQAIEAIGSALRGEAEPIRAYGVLLDDATLKARALALGISDGTSSLTPQQKVLAAQAEILAQTTDAQGDYARTIDSTANVSNRFANTATDLQAKIGGLLAPAFTEAKLRGIDMLSGLSAGLDVWVPRITAFKDDTAAALGGVRDLFTSGDYTGAIGDALSGIFGDVAEDSPIVGVVLTIREALGGLVGFVGPLLAPLGAAFGTVFGALVTTIGPLIPTVLQLAASFSPLGIVLQGLAPILPTLAGLLGTLIGTLGGALGTILPPLLSVAQTISGALIGALVQLAPMVATVAGVLGGVLGEVMVALTPVITTVVGLIAGLLPPIVGLITPLLSVVSAFLPLVGVIGDLIGAVLPPLIALLMTVIEPVVQLAGVLAAALAPVITLVAGIISGLLVPVLTLVVGWLGSLIGVVLNVAGPVLGALVTVLGAVIGWVARVIGSFAAWVSSVGGAGAAIGRMRDAVAEGIGAVVQRFADMPGQVVALLAGLGGRLVGAGHDIIAGFLRGLREGFENVKDFVGGIGSWIADHKGPRDYDLALLRPAGRWILSGLRTGLAEDMPLLEGQLRGIADTVASTRMPALSVDTVALGGVGANAAPVNYGGGALGAQPAPVTVRVYLGNEELTDRVRVVITDTLDAEARAMSYGSTD